MATVPLEIPLTTPAEFTLAMVASAEPQEVAALWSLVSPVLKLAIKDTLTAPLTGMLLVTVVTRLEGPGGKEGKVTLVAISVKSSKRASRAAVLKAAWQTPT